MPRLALISCEGNYTLYTALPSLFNLRPRRVLRFTTYKILPNYISYSHPLLGFWLSCNNHSKLNRLTLKPSNITSSDIYPYGTKATTKTHYGKYTMNLKLSMNDYESIGIKGAHSPNSSEMPELVFSFDNDIGMDDDMNVIPQSYDSISLPSPSPSFSVSQSGYVMISCARHEIKRRCTSTELCESDASTRNQIMNKDQKRRTSLSPSMASSLNVLPPDDNEQNNGPESLSLHLNTPRESAHSPTPEPTTPRTRRFQDSMLSLLSLLPPERYLSPSPSIEEAQFEEIETQQCDPNADAASSASPVHTATANGSSANRSLSSSSCVKPKFLEIRSQFGDADNGTGRKRCSAWV
ncbi:hypothetical protein GGR58DRAFT_475177 [Xylaria digitata]|nr:hypothetical protein GGR58DRAFT_475177 [Xylaria digitata]